MIATRRIANLFKNTLSLATFAALANLALPAHFEAKAQQAQKPQNAQPYNWRELRRQLNENTTTVVSGNPNGTYLYLAYDMSAVLDNGTKLRVLPIIGKGGFQNMKDVLHLKGIDLGITQSNIMRYLKRTGEMGANIQDRLGYIAKLYNEEMHILAGPGIESIADLKGKKVNFSDKGSGTQFSTRLIFDLLKVGAIEINTGQANGYLKVKSGEIAATVLIAGKPTGSFSKFKLEPGMKLLSVPYEQVLEQDYFPAKIGHEDYPNLLKKGEQVDTIAVGAVLAVYLWKRNTERYNRVAKFVDAFFSDFAKFQKPPRHKKWRETNLAAELKGWTRFPAAAEWLAANAAKPRATLSSIDVDLARKQVEQAAPGDKAEQERLFQQFLNWARTQQ